MAKTIIPCCFFPTTVVIIDDDEVFLENLKQALCAKGIIVQAFIEPKAALAFINAQRALDLDEIYNHQVYSSDKNSVYETKIDLSMILQQALNKQRSEKLSVVVTDYHMPPINGLQVCQGINSPTIKKILLTAVAGDDTAVAAFNDGLIDKFISKGEKHLSVKLATIIKELQFTLFAEQSFSAYRFYESVIERNPFLYQKAFLDWFKQHMTENNINEFYLVTDFGMIDFLMLSQSGNTKQWHWLSIRDDENLESLYDIADDHGAPDKVLSQLKAKKVIPVIMQDTDRNCPPNKWESIFYPAEHVKFDEANVYYAFVRDIEVPAIPIARTK